MYVVKNTFGVSSVISPRVAGVEKIGEFVWKLNEMIKLVIFPYPIRNRFYSERAQKPKMKFCLMFIRNFTSQPYKSVALYPVIWPAYSANPQRDFRIEDKQAYIFLGNQVQDCVNFIAC